MEILIISISALIFTIAGVVIMYQQKKVAEKQLKLNLFEKIFKIYLLSEDFIVKIMMGWVTIKECAEYFKQMKEAEYLLDSKLNDLISKIHTAGLELAGLNYSIKDYTLESGNLSEQNLQERKDLMSKKTKLLKSIPQFRDELKVNFAEVLKVN